MRTSDHLELAVSPRGALALLETARALALLDERDYVTPEDMFELAEDVMLHRMRLIWFGVNRSMQRSSE